MENALYRQLRPVHHGSSSTRSANRATLSRRRMARAAEIRSQALTVNKRLNQGHNGQALCS